MGDIVKLIYKGDEMAQGGGSANVELKRMDFNQSSSGAAGEDITLTVNAPHDGFIDLHWEEHYANGSRTIYLDRTNVNNFTPKFEIVGLNTEYLYTKFCTIVPVQKGVNTFHLTNLTEDRANGPFCNYLWYYE